MILRLGWPLAEGPLLRLLLVQPQLPLQRGGGFDRDGICIEGEHTGERCPTNTDPRTGNYGPHGDRWVGILAGSDRIICNLHAHFYGVGAINYVDAESAIRSREEYDASRR